MPSLEQITQTGMVSIDAFRDMRPVMISLAEQMMIEEFIGAINSERVSVENAYRNFWSYEENADIWELPKDYEWKAMLPAWINLLPRISSELEPEKAEELIDVITHPYRLTANEFYDITPEYECMSGNAKGQSPYSPFMEELFFALSIANTPNISEQKVADLVDLVKPFRFRGSSCIPSGTHIYPNVLLALARNGTDTAIEEILFYRNQEPRWLIYEGPYEAVGTQVGSAETALAYSDNRKAHEILGDGWFRNRNFGLSEETIKRPKSSHFEEVEKVFCILPKEFIKMEDIRKKGPEFCAEFLRNLGKEKDWVPIGESNYKKSYMNVRNAHILLKPQGYNPTQKRLVA